MPTKRPSNRPSKAHHSSCHHPTLTLSPSPFAPSAGYNPSTPAQLFTAATGKRKLPTFGTASRVAFPAPLALPGDAVVDDPKYPKQSLRSWEGLVGRNELCERRGVVYVGAAPVVGEGTGLIEDNGCWKGEEVSILLRGKR